MKTLKSLLAILTITILFVACKKADMAQPQTQTVTVTKYDTVYVNQTPPPIYGTWKMVKFSTQIGSGPITTTNESNVTYQFGVDTLIINTGSGNMYYPITYGISTCTFKQYSSILTYTLVWDAKNQQYAMQAIYGAGPETDTYYLQY